MYENFGGKGSVKWCWHFFFWVPKTGTGLSCTIHKIPVNFSLSLDVKPGTSNPNKWYRKFRSFRRKRENGNTSKGVTLFPENFHRDETFHLNFPRNFRVFHTNCKGSKIHVYAKRQPRIWKVFMSLFSILRNSQLESFCFRLP